MTDQRKAWSNASANTTQLSRFDRHRFHTAVFAVSTRCAWCGAAATVADHITPIAFGGSHDPALNGQPMCDACHSIKSKREAAEGRRRAAEQGRTSARRPQPKHPGLL